MPGDYLDKAAPGHGIYNLGPNAGGAYKAAQDGKPRQH